jgi:hypothetical protein
MKLNTNISLENIITVVAIICSMTLAYGYMKSDIIILKEQIDLKVDKRELIADRNLITYKLDVITADIAEMKKTLEKIKGEIHGLRK